MKTLLPVSIACVLLLACGQARAVDAACEPYLRAAEKSSSQPARHMITESDGVRLELISVAGHAYVRMDGGAWQQHSGKSAAGLASAEKKLIEAIRSGEFRISGCRRLAAEKIDGAPMTVYAYTLAMPGAPAGEAKAYVGADGLVHGQRSAGVVVRHRYRGVTAPVR